MKTVGWLISVLALCLPWPVAWADNAHDDVVVIVDTSTSMHDPGMDPERASLLVTKLLADIVPGDLAVVRLLDLSGDKAWLPRSETGQTMPCSEDTSKTCQRVEPTSDWDKDARAGRFGVLPRPSRADADYKRTLVGHLEQKANNSQFNLAFQAALGVFDQHPGSSPRKVMWLSDGKSDSVPKLQEAIAAVKASGAGIEAIVFGNGEVDLPKRMGVDTLKVTNPAEMMKAFANAFRDIVKAPFRIDNLVSAQPQFEMKSNVQEAWVVVYGDNSLTGADIQGPGGTVKADYAADQWPTAGAYRVAYVQRPATGEWTVRVQGGGPAAAYAVIQRSDLLPVLVSPAKVLAGVEVPLVVEIRSGINGEAIADAELLKDALVTAEIEGGKVDLVDNGTSGDATANDGRYSGMAKFSKSGEIPVRLHLKSAIAESDHEAKVSVGGQFNYTGGPLQIDLGSLGVNAETCRPLVFRADHQGEVAFELQSLKSPPSGHTLEVRLPTGVLAADSGAASAKPQDTLNVCLKTAARIASSHADGEPWLALRVQGSDRPEHQIVLKLRWQVQGLSFWALWGWLVELVLAALALLFIALGFILPQRFSGALAVTFVPDRNELDEQSPQPVLQWRGVGIGFYRHARAYLHPDFRLSGKSRGALAGLFAERGGNRAAPGAGFGLFRETLHGDWEPVPPEGCRCRAGDVYRVGSHGPFFRIAARGRG